MSAQPARPALEPVAIVGLAAIMPQAPDAAAFWANLTGGVYSITDVPPQRWDPELYYDPDPHAPDKTYSRIGGWVSDFAWDPVAWRLPVPPTVARQMDDGQRWAVSAARAALVDAGWPDWPVDPERVAVILGNAIGGEKHYRTNLRVDLPEVLRDLRAAPAFAALPAAVRDSIVEQTRTPYLARLPEITEDSMPGELANVIAGRVANLFNFRGPNFTTDAACASALAAMSAAVRGLQTREYDAVVTGGVDRNMGVAAFVKFCRIGALSATGTRPFDAGADGFVMGEGCALFVLKRLSDAERDGDRVYAVVLGVAGSSDGRGKGITAPNPVGQRLAVERAWEAAGADPASASCVEAHGTSTRVGDATELGSLTEVFAKAGAAPGSIALGSVKSNIGHLKAAAGAAGLFKAAMSLHHRVLPPSLSFRDPNPNVDWSAVPFRVNTTLRDWDAPADGGARRAGVSAFGFGGTNFHAVLEEHVPGRYAGRPRVLASAQVPASPRASAPVERRAPLRGALVVGGRDDADVVAQLTRHLDAARAGTAPVPAAPDPATAGAAVRVAVDFADAADLATKLDRAVKAFAAGPAAAPMWKLLRAQGVFVGRGPAPKVAFLYTGQGSQYVNMLAGLRATEPVVADTFAEADEVMTPLLGRSLSSYIFVDGADPVAVERLERQLLQTEITQPAVLATDLALTRLLAAYGVRPDMVMGHSLGEYGALVAAGALTFSSALEAVSARGKEMAGLAMDDNGAMAAVFGPLETIERVVAASPGYVVIANINSTSQAVIGGATAAVEQAIETFQGLGVNAVRIPVSHAFHTSIVAPASVPLVATLRRLDVRPPVLPIVANVTGEFYPRDATTEDVLGMLGRQVASPVQFVRGLRTLYDAGARVFVEVGPRKALAGFVEDVLVTAHDDALGLFTNHPKSGDVASFNAALCGLYAAGLGLDGPAAAPAAPAPSEGTVMSAPQPAVPSPAAVPAAPADEPFATLGRALADVLAQGLRLASGNAGAVAAQPLPAAAPQGPAVMEPVVVSGAALGLPGVDRTFDDENVARILAGQQFIDSLPHRFRKRMVDMHITRLVKSEASGPSFEEISSEADVIKLAGRHAPLDVVEEFGVDAARDAALDTATRLAIGAGFDALRDAGIPLVLRYRTTTLGTRLPDRWGLPDALRDDTGVIFAAAFPGYDSFAADIERYMTDRGRREQVLALEAVRARLTGAEPACAEVDRRIADLRHQLETDPFVFDRRFLFRALSMGHSQFAEIIGARGPNTQVNAACASTTQAVAVAEDWIRAGRCRRVVIVSADDATGDALLPWITSGFLASGAAATDDVVEDAATPFDRRRHGMIVGMGAAALVVESAGAARERGVQPIAEVLGAVTANSAFHGTRLDVEHIGQVMEQVVAQAEARGVDRHAIAAETVFVSHETYTPARGGSASAEINALRSVFGADADRVVITNTKGFTGHAMGAGIEDVVAVKALETGIVPPVPNYKEPDPDLGPLNLSTGGAYPVRYALRLAAGFGSQIAMALLRWTPVPDGRHRAPSELGYAYRIVDPVAWQTWLDRITGRPGARLEVDHRRLRVVDEQPSVPATTPAPAVPASVPFVPAQAAPVEPPAATPAPAAPVATEPVGEPVVEPVTDPVTDAVVGIVSQMTGYPPELLALDLDLEADLGVDTVKQAEVFAGVREHFGVERDANLQLRDFPTLAHVVGWVRSKTGIAAPGAGPVAGQPVPAAQHAEQGPQAAQPQQSGLRGDLAAIDALPRRVPVPVVRPLASACTGTGVTLGAGTRVVLAPDAGGVAGALAKRLDRLGVTVLTLDPGASVDEVTASLDGWLADGPVHGVYWLPALDDEGPLDALDLAGWREALRRRVKTLHATMRRLFDGAPFLVAATRLGGFHGYDAAGATSPLGGAVTGFTKSYKKEQPDALVKAVDLPPADRRTAALADALVEETLVDPGCVEVGRPAGAQRWGVGLAVRPFPALHDGCADGEGGLVLDGGSTVVVTGAAGSIVSAITADLAAASGATFHLLDLTPAPDPADPDLQRYLVDRDGLKTELAARMKDRGERPTPVAIDKELAGFERLAAALAAIRAVEAAGGTARYHSVDLTDAAAVAAVVADVQASSQRVDLLLHAAGLEISRGLPAKEAREFDLVLDVKCDGWFGLLHALGDTPIGATVVFSSVAGRFGNAGQTDYAAANDLLCKVTSSLRRTRPGTRAIALDWTAWGGIGMATRGSIPKIMEAAGVEMLPPEAGIAWIRRELVSSGFGGEVVVAGRLGLMAVENDPAGGLDVAAVDVAGCGPMVGVVAGVRTTDGLVVTTTLDPAVQPFLDHHRIDGVPVLPGVMGMEAFVESARLAARLGGVRHEVTGLEDVAFLAPVKFYRDEPRTLTVTTLLRADAAGDLVAECRLEAQRVLPGAADPVTTVHFTGRVRLSTEAAPAAPDLVVDLTEPAAGTALGPDAVYRLYFHGPAYQVVGGAWRTGDGATARLADPLPEDHVPAAAPLASAPRLVELCFQAAGLWEAGRQDRLALPRAVARVRWVAGPPPSPGAGALFAVATAEAADGVFDCAVVDAQGHVVLALDGYATVPLPAPLPDDVSAPLRDVFAG